MYPELRRCLSRLMVVSVAALSGCAMVTVESIKPEEYVSLRRGDVLTTGELSAASMGTLEVEGLTEKACKLNPVECRQTLLDSIGLSAEQKMSALSEMWLKEAIFLYKENPSEIGQQQALNAFFQAARYAYAYLFYTERAPSDRALEDRQGQVRDYYNFATQQAVSGFLIRQLNALNMDGQEGGGFEMRQDPWRINGQLGGLGLGRGLPKGLVPASTLNFAGLRNQYRREGLGAELVAVFDQTESNGEASSTWSETPFPAVTVTLIFPGDSLGEILGTNRVTIRAFDPYRQSKITINRIATPLAANFTSGYGLWLARSGFAQQSLLTMIGRGEPLEEARIYLMQPFDPNRRLIIMLHGLGSSPEAWVNVANEVLGDEKLRQNYQIWQVYYPTQLPLAFNRLDIQNAIEKTLAHFDPKGESKASSKVTLIGHSMGGVLSRLLVTDSGDTLYKAALERYPVADEQKREALEGKLKPLLDFQPLPQVSRAVFIAAPHRGSPLAQNSIARFFSSLIKLPATVLGKFTEIAQLLVVPGSANSMELSNSPTSIDNLSDKDPFVRASADLPISDQVIYHSVIGNDTPDVPLKESSDGVVPYSSATLPGASSELVVRSWHSVQEQPQAIVEIRRILHLHLNSIARHDMVSRLIFSEYP